MTDDFNNDATWRTCFDDVGPKLLLFARQWASSPADAEDIVQEVFVRFWRRERSFETRNVPLLFTMVRHAAIDWRRRNERRRNRETFAVADASTTREPLFEAAMADRDRAEAIECALADLPHEQREVIMLKVWGELTFAQVAAVLDIPQNTAASRYRYALEALRRNASALLK